MCKYSITIYSIQVLSEIFVLLCKESSNCCDFALVQIVVTLPSKHFYFRVKEISQHIIQITNF